MAKEALTAALGVEIDVKSFRTGVVYRHHGQIDWKALPAGVIVEYVGRDVHINVAGELYAVELHGSKAIVPLKNKFSI